MRKIAGLSLSCVLLLTASLFQVAPAQGASGDVQISVSAPGAEMYPQFDPAISRYAITTTPDTNGSINLSVAPGGPSARVYVNGALTSGAETKLSGLTQGDEISVIVADSGTRRAYALVYLPAGFPKLTTTVDTLGDHSDGIFLTLTNWTRPGPSYEVLVDRHGVPVYLKSTTGGILDFKPAPHGHYTVFRSPADVPGKTGGQVVELDEQFRTAHAYSTVDMANTDGHDAILRPDGSRILIANEMTASRRLHAVIQEIAPDGSPVFTWNSSGHIDPATESTTAPDEPDYVHLNSIAQLADGDILASFRHTSSIVKIAWSDHDGHRKGDVVWRLGGRLSDFAFENDPYPGGPCAQHSVTQLPNGHILIFDNGSAALGGGSSLCVDPTNPSGPTASRPQTRITEYALDEQAGTADLVWSYQVPGRFAWFMGSAQRLANGDTLIGWASAPGDLTSQVSAEGEVVWALQGSGGYITYRAAEGQIRDALAPEVRIAAPTDGATYTLGQSVTPTYSCTDRGGSTLQECTVTSPVDTTTTGQRSFSVTAADGAGHVTTSTRHYTVGPAPQTVDALVRASKGWVGSDTFGDSSGQRVTVRLRRRGAVRWATARLQNEGGEPNAITVQGSRGTRKFRVWYYDGSRNVTSRVVAGTWTTSALPPGASQDLRIRIKRLRPARRGNSYLFALGSASGLDGSRDQVGVWARARR